MAQCTMQTGPNVGAAVGQNGEQIFCGVCLVCITQFGQFLQLLWYIVCGGLFICGTICKKTGDLRETRETRRRDICHSLQRQKQINREFSGIKGDQTRARRGYAPNCTLAPSACVTFKKLTGFAVSSVGAPCTAIREGNQTLNRPFWQWITDMSNGGVWSRTCFCP